MSSVECPVASVKLVGLQGKKKKPFRISCNPQLTVLEMHIRAVAERIAARSHL